MDDYFTLGWFPARCLTEAEHANDFPADGATVRASSLLACLLVCLIDHWPGIQNGTSREACADKNYHDVQVFTPGKLANWNC